MEKIGRKLAGAFFDVRVIVTLCGVLLSIVAHELFHIILHLGEIDSIHILPSSQAIVEIIFTPTRQYNIALEEGVAYIITMTTLLLTVMLVSDIRDTLERKTPTKSSLPQLLLKGNTPFSEEETRQLLGKILGI